LGRPIQDVCEWEIITKDGGDLFVPVSWVTYMEPRVDS